MQSKIEKPYVLRVAEFIYFKIIDIKNKNPETNNIQAFEIFMTTKEYELISSGEFHDKWFEELEKNNFVDKLTGKKITDISTIMERDKFFSPEEAIKFGLIDKIVENRK